MTIPLDKLLLTRIAKLPENNVSDYIISFDGLKEEPHFKYLGYIVKAPWGGSGFFTHIGNAINETRTDFRVNALTLPNFLINSTLILPKGTKINKWNLKVGKLTLQTIDSWFAYCVSIIYKRGLPMGESSFPCPFYYGESTLKALPLFVAQKSGGISYEIEVSDRVERLKMVNEYATSVLESTMKGEKMIMQHVPWFKTITIDVTAPAMEIKLNSEKKIVRAIFFRVYDGENEDLQIVKRVEIRPDIGEVEVEMCRVDNKYRYSTEKKLPYYVYPLCVDPKSKVPGYGDVFTDEVMIIEIEGIREGLKIDVLLESIDKVAWAV